MTRKALDIKNKLMMQIKAKDVIIKELKEELVKAGKKGTGGGQETEKALGDG